MESGNHLGIYLGKDRATLVCLAPPGRDRKMVDCFSVSVDGQQEQEQGYQALADRIRHVIRQRKVKFTEAAVALDCASFMQHSVRSAFSEARRITVTVRSDTEETLATDISDMAVSFRVTSSDEQGAHLEVFTAQRAILTDAILSLQSTGIDPVAMDPDICCLARYLTGHTQEQGTPEQSTLYALLSDSRGYLVVVSGSKAAILRTFLIGPAQERTELLLRETLVTIALAEGLPPVGSLRVFDTTGGLREETLRERTGLEVGTCDLTGLVGTRKGAVPEDVNPVDFALACGAALSPAEKTNSVSLRNDHMPYLGKKRRLQNAMRLLSISVTILLLAVGVYFHSQMIRVNKQRESLRAKLEADYLPVMPGKTKLPTPMTQAINDLEKTLRILRAEKQGIGANQESVSAKLTLVLQGLNGCARETNLEISSITIGTTGIMISGDTSSRLNAVDILQKAMKKVGLLLDSHDIHSDNGRDSFTIRLKVEPGQKAQGA